MPESPEQDQRYLAKKAFTTFEVARICDVTPVTIQNWIDKGWLHAYRTAGGHRRVRREDLLAFLESRNIPHTLSGRPGGSAKVLIIGGDEEANGLLREVLRGEDGAFEAHVAQDAFHAGVLFASVRPAAVLLDCTLPAADNFSVCRQILQSAPGGGAAVIAILGTGDTETRARLLQLGVTHSVQKPIDTVALRELIQQAIRKGRPSGGASPA
ncbi:MAG: helix-turn-helix domain-containing protein [Nitrospinota bacterium]